MPATLADVLHELKKHLPLAEAGHILDQANGALRRKMAVNLSTFAAKSPTPARSFFHRLWKGSRPERPKAINDLRHAFTSLGKHSNVSEPTTAAFAKGHVRTGTPQPRTADALAGASGEGTAEQIASKMRTVLEEMVTPALARITQSTERATKPEPGIAQETPPTGALDASNTAPAPGTLAGIAAATAARIRDSVSASRDRLR